MGVYRQTPRVVPAVYDTEICPYQVLQMLAK